MPFAVAARQARHFGHQHDPDLAEPDGGDQSLEPCALMAAGTRQSEIVIDDLHLRQGPSHVPRPLGQLVLPSCTLLILEHLALRRLPDVDHRLQGCACPPPWNKQGRVHAIPTKRHDQMLVGHLTMEEVRAVLDAPDLSTRLGVRDSAMLHLCFADGLRVSELVELPLAHLCLLRAPSLRVLGKGRRERCLPLWKETAADLRAWLAIRGQIPSPELFVNAEGTVMTRAGFEYVLDKHVRAAAVRFPALAGRSVTPHQLRHSCAVTLNYAERPSGGLRVDSGPKPGRST